MFQVTSFRFRVFDIPADWQYNFRNDDANTLREAQKHPDEYRNLLVRVTGYNAYFVGIGKEIQDEIIARESHRL